MCVSSVPYRGNGQSPGLLTVFWLVNGTQSDTLHQVHNWQTWTQVKNVAPFSVCCTWTTPNLVFQFFCFFVRRGCWYVDVRTCMHAVEACDTTSCRMISEMEIFLRGSRRKFSKLWECDRSGKQLKTLNAVRKCMPRCSFVTFWGHLYTNPKVMFYILLKIH